MRPRSPGGGPRKLGPLPGELGRIKPHTGTYLVNIVLEAPYSHLPKLQRYCIVESLMFARLKVREFAKTEHNYGTSAFAM